MMLDIAIDVSDAQGPPNPPIDWNAVYNAGILIAFVKALEGTGTSYPTWRAQSSGARAAGIKVIPYFFLRPVDPAAAIAHFVGITGLMAGMPFALDWEGSASQTCTPAIAETIGTGLNKVAMRSPIGYWGMPGSTPAQPTDLMQTWDRWIPEYPEPVADFSALSPAALNRLQTRAMAQPGALFVQYTSSGIVPGITGNVDRSIWLGSLDQLTAWFASGARPA
jgi:lysozyme